MPSAQCHVHMCPVPCADVPSAVQMCPVCPALVPSKAQSVVSPRVTKWSVERLTSGLSTIAAGEEDTCLDLTWNDKFLEIGVILLVPCSFLGRWVIDEKNCCRKPLTGGKIFIPIRVMASCFVS